MEVFLKICFAYINYVGSVKTPFTVQYFIIFLSTIYLNLTSKNKYLVNLFVAARTNPFPKCSL